MTPACNTGVHPPSLAPFSPVSRFDWYRATVPAHHELVLRGILEIAGDGVQVIEAGGRFNYLRCTEIQKSGDRIATVLHGGPNGHPNVEASGEQAPPLADYLRGAWEGHRVTRCDVAVDLHGDTAFSALRGVADRLSEKHQIRCRTISDRDPAKGDTVYLGSRESAVFARIYEKGKADAGKYENQVPREVLHGWVRIELEVKPQKAMKLFAASLEPAQFWGVSEWTAQLAEEAFQVAPDPIPFHPRRTATDDRAFGFMCDQYRNLLRRRCQERHGGDREALAREILARIYEEDSTAEKAA